MCANRHLSMASRTERSEVRWPALARRLQLFTFPDVSRSAKVTHSAQYRLAPQEDSSL